MGSRRRSRPGPPRRFVVQEHHARALHWDFRLERDGVLVSWALPRGVPLNPRRNHLAVAVEDHPLEYGGFAGEIPAGEYGAGTVSIWDSGTYETLKWSDREVMVVLHGGRVNGRYVLFKTDEKNWMIHRMDPAPDEWDPAARPHPSDAVPSRRAAENRPGLDVRVQVGRRACGRLHRRRAGCGSSRATTSTSRPPTQSYERSAERSGLGRPSWTGRSSRSTTRTGPASGSSSNACTCETPPPLDGWRPRSR